ncbi:MAG TPA: hypothetical protein VIM89_01955 [Mucilaginibacter sp.]
MSHYYKIYGLKIKSSREIDLLYEQPECDIDLSVDWIFDTENASEPTSEWEQLTTRQLQTKNRISFFRSRTAEGEYVKICFKTEFGQLAAILDPAKKNLWIFHNERIPQSHMNSFFVGSILGCVLRLKGILCFHGSVINIDGQAVVLIGKKKSGKSTTASAFSKLGFKVLSDDIAVISMIGEEFFVEPGYAKVRLRPKPLKLFYPDNNYNFVSVYSHRDSRYSDLNDSFWDTCLPLGAIYVLGETEGPNDRPFVTTISAERIIHLHSNTFVSYIITPDLQKQEFNALAQIAIKIPVQHLHFGHNVELVYLQCEAILEDFKQLNRLNAEL